jgi:hypothetical protein
MNMASEPNMNQMITEYYRANARTPELIANEALTAKGYAGCVIPSDYNFRKAYVIAIEFVGHQNFVARDREFWFESAALAMQYRLMLP